MSLLLSANGSEYPQRKRSEHPNNQKILSMGIGQTVARLAQAVLSVRPLVNALEGPVCVAPLKDGNLIPAPSKEYSPVNGCGIETLLNRIATRLSTCKFEFARSQTSELTAFDHVVSYQLDLSPDYWATFWVSMEVLPDVDNIVDTIVKHSLESYFKYSEVVSFDGVLLRAYAGGVPDRKVVVIVPACGMPVKLCERWLRYLAQEHYVITWESRGLFGKVEEFDTVAYDLPSQASDLFAVMNHFGVESGHVMGLCGGAVIALASSSMQPERVSSLSLWHGDYELGPNCPKTNHQQDLELLISMAGKSRKQAMSLQKLFTKPSILAKIRADVAHLILYPYATGELLFRYAKLNGSIMTYNVQHILSKVSQPTLVVTSEDDTTAHPEGSLRVASKLSNVTLQVEPHGDHLSLFDANPTITQLATRFIQHETL
jgi:pimeloyl-ACP methyl ester carboxylesterase